MSDERDDQQAPAGVYRVDVAPSAERIAEWRRAGWTVATIEADTRADFLDAIGRALAFPDWYGHNLDALWDCLGEVTHPVVVVWHGWRSVAAEDERRWGALHGLLEERSQAEPAFTVLLA